MKLYDSIGPIADLLQRQRGFSDSQIGLLNAIYGKERVGKPETTRVGSFSIPSLNSSWRSTSRRKFCLCRRPPDKASTARCS